MYTYVFICPAEIAKMAEAKILLEMIQKKGRTYPKKERTNPGPK
jgi:hypothetical protein